MSMGREWGGGMSIGSVYQLDDYAISRVGNCHVEVGYVKIKGGKLISHTVSKATLLEIDDLVLCTAHSGDCFYDFELLYIYENNLCLVNGMDFGAYAFGEPTSIKLNGKQMHSILADISVPVKNIIGFKKCFSGKKQKGEEK